MLRHCRSLTAPLQISPSPPTADLSLASPLQISRHAHAQPAYLALAAAAAPRRRRCFRHCRAARRHCYCFGAALPGCCFLFSIAAPPPPPPLRLCVVSDQIHAAAPPLPPRCCFTPRPDPVRRPDLRAPLHPDPSTPSFRHPPSSFSPRSDAFAAISLHLMDSPPLHGLQVTWFNSNKLNRVIVI